MLSIGPGTGEHRVAVGFAGTVASGPRRLTRREHARHVLEPAGRRGWLELGACDYYNINEIVKLTLSVPAQSNYMAVAPVNGVKTGVHVRDSKTTAVGESAAREPCRTAIPAARPTTSGRLKTAGHSQSTASPYPGENAAAHPLSIRQGCSTPRLIPPGHALPPCWARDTW